MIPKFRAYSKEENEMYYPHNDKNVDWTIDDETGFIAPLVNLGSGMWGMIDKYELMQSTGLKDKNGVEIFEGDIVLFTIEDGFDYVYGKPGRINLSLQWGAGVRASSRGNYPLRKCREVRIIGNIYENPELLEVQR